MRIAVFGTLWNEEGISYYYDGFNQWADETGDLIDCFLCYGKTDITDAYNIGEYGIYNYPDLEEYDAAVIISSTINCDIVRKKLTEMIKEAGIKCISIDAVIPGFTSIGIDQKKYIREMVCHVHDVHMVERMCYIGGTPSNVESEARKQGFYEGMEKCSLAIREDWVFEKNFAFEDGFDVVAELYEKDPTDFPDAIICANDDMAAGVCNAMEYYGLIPGLDCCVTGFDQYFIGENFVPCLTTVRRARAELTYEACRILRDSYDEHFHEVKAGLVYGETCGCHNHYVNNDNYFRKRAFEILNNRVHLSDVLAHIEYEIASGRDIEEVLTNICGAIAKFGKGKFRLYFNPGIKGSSMRGFDTYKACTDCYGFEEIDDLALAKGHAYIHVPIHFGENRIGIFKFRDLPKFMVNKELYNFTKTFGLSIENMLRRKETNAANEKLQELFETDFLTGTYNRYGYSRYSKLMMKEAKETGKKLIIVFADLDGLKKINDELGHEAGDLAIRLVGESARQIAEAHHDMKAFRYGGDEFVILKIDDGSCDWMIEALNQKLAERMDRVKPDFELTVSAGQVVVDPEGEDDFEASVKKADEIMYEFKRKKKAAREQKL